VVVPVTNPFDEYDAPLLPPIGPDLLMSLREAIVLLDSLGGGTLDFSPLGGTPAKPATVFVAGPLPSLTVPVTIDAGHAVQIVGAGLDLAAPGNTVKGLTIDYASGPGLQLDAGGNDIENNFLGTDPTGHKAEGNLVGLKVIGPDNKIIKNNVISGNTLNGIEILSSGNVVQHNLVGTDVDGIMPLPNRAGVAVFGPDNTIGGPLTTDGNVISGNSAYGVCLDGAGATANHVEGNYIGTTAAPLFLLPPGTTSSSPTADGLHGPLPNDIGVGIFSGASGNFIGGASEATRNIISGNQTAGVLIAGSATTLNVVHGNYIGTDADGIHELGNAGSGVVIRDGAHDNRIGSDGSKVGDTSERNIISNNGVYSPGSTSASDPSGKPLYGKDGVAILDSGTDENLVAGNFVGLDKFGVYKEGNAGRGVAIYNGAQNNVIGVDGKGKDPAMQRNVISNNRQDGVAISDSGTDTNKVAGNLIGLSPLLTTPRGNGGSGVVITNHAKDNVIGTDLDAMGNGDDSKRNIISANSYAGVLIDYGSSVNFVRGNYIGTLPDGETALGNKYGVIIDHGAFSNLVGGTGSATGNVLSGNSIDGVLIQQDVMAAIAGVAAISGISAPSANTTLNTVEGNFIGANKDGTAELGNLKYGVEIRSAVGNFIGGMTDKAGNVISGNWGDGVRIWNPGPHVPTPIGNVVEGNHIGTTKDGTAALSNGLVTPANGVSILNSSFNTIGGDIDGEGNIISGNEGYGVWIAGASFGNVLQGNFIGTKKDGTSKLGNSLSGVFITLGASGNTVGVKPDPIGPDHGKANTIAFNGGSGVVVESGTGNAMRGNAIFANGGLGIDLGNTGAPTLNDSKGHDGPNDYQNFPVLTKVDPDGTVHVKLHGADKALYRIEFFSSTNGNPSLYGDGQTFLTFVDKKTDDHGNLAFALKLAPGKLITATATDPAGNTSEFSSYVMGDLAIVRSDKTPLPDEQDLAPGGYVAVNNDNDDYTFNADGSPKEDRFKNGVVVGEHDLVRLDLHAVANAQGGAYTLVFGPNIKIWKSATKGDPATDLVVSDTTDLAGVNGATSFSAAKENTVWVEGINESDAPAKELITLKWTNADAAKGVIADKVVLADQVAFTVYMVTGPLNVPGFSIYTYKADVPGGLVGSWTAASGTVQTGAMTNTATILWNSGPVVGQANFTPLAGFTCQRYVNVVLVELEITGGTNKLEYKNPPKQSATDSRLIISNNLGPAENANIRVKTIEGPIVAGQMRGVKFIEMGFIQNGQFTREYGDFDGFDTKKRRQGGLQDGAFHVDYYTQAPNASTAPWYDSQAVTGTRGFLGPAMDAKLSNQDFNVSDTPQLWGSDAMTLTLGGVTKSVNRFGLQFDLNLYFAVRTKEAVNGSETVYTQRAKASWRFDGSGTIDAAGNWTQTGTGNTGDKKFTEVKTGDVVPVTTGTAINNLFAGEVWSTINQP
jgi:hypothetical protein